MRYTQILGGGFSGQCQRLAGGVEQCGLLAPHDGDHLPFTPGDYLPPPIIHPLDLWRLSKEQRCPQCRERLHALHVGPPTHAFRGDTENWSAASVEAEFVFYPCHCVMRQLVVDLKETL